jgi:uncharacterized surface anchored protein
MYKYVDGVNDVKYATATTDAKGIAYFGHRNDESGGQTIDRNTLYYIVETWAPSGYTVDPTPYYFNFKTADAEEITLDGVDVHKLASGAAITLVNEYTSTQNISVIKKWNDGDDEYGTRPDSITINLYKNGEEIDSKVITADDGWECTFDNMDRYDESGDEITYTVQEEQVEGYQSRISGDAEDGFIITNSYNLKSVDEPTDPDDPVDPEDPTPSKDKVTPVVPTKVVITSRVTKSIPITGDEMGSFLWIVLMVATGSAALGTYTLLKKQKDR